MRVYDVVDLAASEAPPQRNSIDDIIAAGERVARRRRAGRIATGVAGLAAVAVAAAIAVPNLVGRGSDGTGGGAQAGSPGGTTVAQNAPKDWAFPAQPFTFTFKGYDVGKFHVSDPLSATPAYQIADLVVDGLEPPTTPDPRKGPMPSLPPQPKVTGYLVVYRPGAFDPDKLTGTRKLTVAGRPALSLTQKRPATQYVLAWEYADKAWAAIYTYPRNDSYVTVEELVTVAAGLKPADPVAVKVPFTMSYVPADWRPVTATANAMPGVSGTAGGQKGHYGGAVFARKAPALTGLTAPWDDTADGDVPDSFTIFISSNDTPNQSLKDGEKPPAEPQCIEARFCNFWTPDGKVRMQVSSEARLSVAEMAKILTGMKFLTVDPAAWTDAATAIPVKP